MSRHSQGHHKPGNRVKDPRVAFERGKRDARAGVSFGNVPYKDRAQTEAWEDGWREYYNQRPKGN